MMDYHQEDHGIRPRIIIHGGAGNIRRDKLPADKYQEYRHALLAIIRDAADHMDRGGEKRGRGGSAVDVACHAVVQLEDNGLFNSGHGAVFTRDGINELEASLAVSRGPAKRCVGVSGLRHVRNPILLAREMLRRGDRDVWPPAATPERDELDVPSAQAHTLLWGRAAEQLARDYGLDMVDPAYFFTQRRWHEHLDGLERERSGRGAATWAADDYVAQGTCGAVALDSQGVVCVATSTGGLTNKLTGRVGDTPVPGAGFWAEEWPEHDTAAWERGADGAALTLSGPLRGLLADCLATPFLYAPPALFSSSSSSSSRPTKVVTTRSFGVSGTGNGDSFLRTCAAHSVGALAKYGAIAGPRGELQRSAGDRWGRTGEGEGGMIGIECLIDRDAETRRVVRARSQVVMDFNCAGMFRAWIDDDGRPVMSVWTNGAPDRPVA